jgi:hypothetical protein
MATSLFCPSSAAIAFALQGAIDIAIVFTFLWPRLNAIPTRSQSQLVNVSAKAGWQMDGRQDRA